MLSFKGFWTNKTLVGLGLGQLLSLLNSQEKAKWYYYIALAWADVEANFLVIKYRLKKLSSAAICIAVLVIVIFSDVHASDRAGGSSPLKGDLFVIVGPILYAASNVSEEFLVKCADRVEVMAMLGLFGAIVSAIQISILERNELKSIHWPAGAPLPFVGFSAALFMFYSLAPVLLKLSGSAMLNLSLLTSDMWTVLIRIFAYHQKVDWMYFIAFAAVVVGLIIYSGGDKDDEQHYAKIADEDAEGSRHFDEEAVLLGNSNHSSMAGA